MMRQERVIVCKVFWEQPTANSQAVQGGSSVGGKRLDFVMNLQRVFLRWAKKWQKLLLALKTASLPKESDSCQKSHTDRRTFATKPILVPRSYWRWPGEKITKQ
jgi:hypothetical protein